MSLEVDAQHLPDLTLIPVGVPVKAVKRWNGRIVPGRFDLEHGHHIMSSVAGHDLHNLHLISGDPVHASTARVMIEVELVRQMFADIQDLLGVNGGPEPAVRFHPGV